MELEQPDRAPCRTQGSPSRLRDRVLTALLLLGWLAYSAFACFSPASSDLAALYMAGHFWAVGQPGLVYAQAPEFFGATPPQWAAAQDALGLAGPAYPYIYPPLWLPLLAPLSEALAPARFFWLAHLLQSLALAAALPLAWRVMRPTDARPALPCWQHVLGAIALMLLTVPYAYAADLNQPQILVSVLVILAFERYRAGAAVTAGIVLALASAMKLSPALFALIFLLDRNRPALLAFAMSGAALGLASLALPGPAMTADFLEALRRFGDISLVSLSNISLRSVLLCLEALWRQGPAGLPAVNTADPGAPRWITTALQLAMLLAVLLLFLARRRPAGGSADWRTDLGPQLIYLSLVATLLGPVGWLHYLLVPLLLLPGLAPRLPRTTAIASGALCVAAFSPLTLRLVLDHINPATQAAAVGTGVLLLAGLAGLALRLLAGHDAPECRGLQNGRTTLPE